MRVGIVCEGSMDFAVLRVVCGALLGTQGLAVTLLQPRFDALQQREPGAPGPGWQGVRAFLQRSAHRLAATPQDVVVVQVDADIRHLPEVKKHLVPRADVDDLTPLCDHVKSWMPGGVPEPVVIVLPREATEAWLCAVATHRAQVEAIPKPAEVLRDAGVLGVRGGTAQAARALVEPLCAAGLPRVRCPYAMKPNIFDLARSNGPSLEARLDRMRVDLSESTQMLDNFCAAIRSAARVTINMGSWKLTHLLATDAYPNPYDRAKDVAARTGRAPEDVLREGQGRFYARRVRFDRHFVDGERFVYGALNLRGVGPRYYGRYCVALKVLADNEPVALLPGNSLELYVDDAGETVDEQGVARDAGAWSHREHIAACKHGDSLRTTDPAQWPDMVCSPKENEQRFIEAILGEAVSRVRVEEIRIAGEDAARLRDLLTRALTGESLTPEEQLEHAGQLDVLDALARSGLTSQVREV